MPKLEDLTFLEEGHIYRVGGAEIPSVSRVLDEGGFVEKGFYGPQHSSRGQAVHLAIEYFLEGDLDWDSVHPTIKPYVEAFAHFTKLVQYKPVLTEVKIWHPIHRYAGTIDLIGYVNGKVSLIDTKSGQIPCWAELQVSGYEMMVECWESLPRIEQVFILNLKETGRPYLKAIDTKWARRVFLGAVAGFHWRVEHKMLRLA